MMNQNESKNKSQWYSTDKYDDATSLQKWDDNGTMITPNYHDAYVQMMSEVSRSEEK